MALTLYYHPLASFCWKPLIAFYEKGIPFTPHLVDLSDEASARAFLKVWPIGEFPVLKEGERILPGSSAIIEYLDLYAPATPKLIPSEPELALEARRWDSFYDAYVHVSMQKIVLDCLRPEGKKDPTGVAEVRSTLATAYDVLEEQMKNRTWAIGEKFTLADCSAAPPLYYGNKVQPFGKSHPVLSSYLERLMRRPSFARVLKEAEPYFHMFPYKE